MANLADVLSKLENKLATMNNAPRTLSGSLQAAGQSMSAMGPSRGGMMLQSLGGVLGGAGDLTGRLQRAASSDQGGFAGAAAGGLRGVGSLAGSLGALAGPEGMVVGKVVEGLTNMAASLAELPGKLREWGNQLHEANLKFAEFSASMGQVKADSDQRDFYLKQSQGESRAASAQYLSEQKGKFDQVMSPLEDLWAKVENYVSGMVLAKLSELVWPISAIAKWLGSSGASDTEDPGINEWLETMDREAKAAVARRPGRMRN